MILNKSILILSLLFTILVACADDPKSEEDTFDPDGSHKKKYAKQERNIKICQSIFILLALEDQKQKCLDPASLDCKNFSYSKWMIPIGNCYGYPNM